MMLQIIAYTITAAAALSVAAVCAERFAQLQGTPRRTAWIIVMVLSVLSVLLPMAMLLVSRPPAIQQAPLAASQRHDPVIARLEPIDRAESSAEFAVAPVRADVPVEPVSMEAQPQSATWRLPLPSDRQLIAAWIVASSLIALYLIGASILLRRRAAGWQRATVLDQDVLVSEVTGPALLGVLRPHIVVPRWLLQQPRATQALILEHEQQHREARDPLLIFTGLLVITAVPWNLPLWWQWRRMRQAIELDCDARVMHTGAEATTYAEVLLAVAQRATRMPAGALAMSEPVHALERRISSLVPDATRFATVQAIAVLLLAAAGAGAAWALEAPALPKNAAAIAPMRAPSQGAMSWTPAFTPVSSITVVAAAQSAIVAAAPAPRAIEPAPTVQSPAPAELAAEPAPFMVRIHAPVAEPALPPYSRPEAFPPPSGGVTAASRAQLGEYYTTLVEKLRAVPGLELITEATPGVPGVPYEIVIKLGADWEGVQIEASSVSAPLGPKVLWLSEGARASIAITPRLTALWENIPVNKPDLDMDRLVERMRLELFPPDRALLDQKMAVFRNPALDLQSRRFALYQLMSNSRRRGSRDGNRIPQTYRPDPTLLDAVTEVALTSDDPALRLQIWGELGSMSIPQVDPAVLLAPAGRALAREADLRVQLMLVNILSARPTDPRAREALDSVANSDADSDRPDLVRMAARRVLNGGAGWSEYIVATMQDPQTSDDGRLELMNYVYTLRMLPGDAAVRLDEAAERGLASMVKQGSPKVARAAISLLGQLGSSVTRKEIVDVLRSGIGQSQADSEIRSAALSSLSLSLRLHPEDRPLFEEIRVRDRDPVLREAAGQALDQTK